MPEHSDLALVSTLVLVGLTCVIGIETLDKTSAIEVGCLQLLATGQKDLPPVHICSWIVLWQESGDAVQAISAAACKEAEYEKAGRFNGKCMATFTSIFNGLSIQLTQSHLLSFVAAYKSHIASVHQDGGVSPTDIQYDAPWPLDRIDQDALPLNHQYRYSNTGSNVNVYVIDTGIRTSHDEFKYADGRPGSRAREVFSSLSTGTVGQDCTGHGTHVAASVGGLQFGAAKNSTLLSVRALDCNADNGDASNNTGVTQVVQGLEWVKDNFVAPAVVVMALGGDPQYALDLAVAEVVRAGVAVLVAAGNGDTDACLKSPAREPLAITVSATDQNDSRIWERAGTGSNYGTCVDIWAPGNATLSASNVSDNAVEYRSGTSQAVPCVAGAAAIYLQNNTGATPLELSTALMSAGSWGVVHEPSASGPLNADVLDNTNNVMVNTAMFHAVTFQPQSLQVAGGKDGLGPFFFNVTLAQEPKDRVSIGVGLSNSSRGDIAPSQLTFTTDSWFIPQQVNLSTASKAFQTVDSDLFYVQLDLISNDTNFNNTHPRLQVADSKGNSVAYPKAVLGLPFSDQGNSYFFSNDYEMQCKTANQGTTGGGKDVVYFFQPEEDCLVTVSTCNSAQFMDNFDTVLYVLGNATGSGQMEVVACNDDACSYFSQLQVNMTAGSAYAIVLDGYNGNFGKYQIDITAEEGGVTGAMPPLDLGALIHMPTPPEPLPSSTATPEPSPEEGSYFEIGQASPAAVMVPMAAPPANPPVPGANGILPPSNSAEQASPNNGRGNASSPAGSEKPSGNTGGRPAPNSPVAGNGGAVSGLQPGPRWSPLEPPAAASPVFLQAASPRQGLSAEALLAQRSPIAGAPIAPSLIPLTAEAELGSARTAENASSPGAETAKSPAHGGTALECHLHASPTACSSPPPALSSSPNAQPPVLGSLPTTTTPPTPLPNLPSSSASPRQAVLFASSSASLPPNPPPPATSPSPALTSPYTYAFTPYGAAPLTGPDAVPTSLLPYGIPLPMYAAFPPAPASAVTTAPAPGPALAPGAALTPTAASAAEAAPSPMMLSRVLLASPPDQSPLPAAHSSKPQLNAPTPSSSSSGDTALSQTQAEGPKAAWLSDVAGATSARVEASVRPAAGESSGKGGGGLDAKTIGIVAGAVAAVAVVLSVGLYAHITSRKRRNDGSKGEPKGAAAEARRAADDSQCSQPPFPIAQSQLPQGGLFEPLSCPPALCSAPGSFNQNTFMQSITSNKSGSMAAGKLGPYHAVMLTSNKLAVHQHESLHGIAQQAQQRQAPHSNSGLIRSAVAQQAQHAADEALSQEAAAVEEALGSFNRPSSSAALHSGHTPAPLLTHALTNAPAQAAAATHSASQLTTASQQEEVSQGGAPQQLVVQSAAVQHPAGQLQADARGLQLTAPEGRLLTQAQVKALTSLEVARQRQANRAQLQLGLPAQYQGPFPRPAPTAGQLQPSRLPHAPYPGQWAGQMQQKGLLGPKPAGDALGRRLGSIQEKLPTRVEADPAQKARAKLHAIRNELGALEKARKSMIHQQPGGLASHLRGSVIRTNSALPPTALAGPQACSALHQSSARAPKHAQHAQHATPSSWPQPGSAPAAVTGEVSKGDHSGDSVTSSRPRGTIASLQEANGMSWNPVRLTSPFESATEPATGRIGTQATHRSGWSLHSITFSAADAVVSKDARQLTLSQMTWSMEQSRQI